jgi:drug/metabolite transporter (DMT)-like permease
VALLLAGPPGGAPRDWLLVAGAGLVGIAFSSVLFYVALGRIGAARTTALFGTSSLFGAGFAAVALHERLGPAHALAAGLVVAGLAVLAVRPKPDSARG